MFRTESVSGVTRNGRLLPAVSTFKEWDSRGGIRGGTTFNLANSIRKTGYMRTRIAMHLDATDLGEVVHPSNPPARFTPDLL
jgi:hypothetical protein